MEADRSEKKNSAAHFAVFVFHSYTIVFAMKINICLAITQCELEKRDTLYDPLPNTSYGYCLPNITENAD